MIEGETGQDRAALPYARLGSQQTVRICARLAYAGFGTPRRRSS